MQTTPWRSRLVVGVVVAIGCISSSPLHAEIQRWSFWDQPAPVQVICDANLAEMCMFQWGALHNLFDYPTSMCTRQYVNGGNTLGDYFVLDKAQGRVRLVGTRLEDGIRKFAFVREAEGGTTPFRSPESITLSTTYYVQGCCQYRQLYVADSGNNRIGKIQVEYHSGVPYLLPTSYIYGAGQQPAGPLNAPHDIDYCTYTDNVLQEIEVILVADTYNHRILGLRTSGEVLWTVGGTPGNGTNQFRFPYAITGAYMGDAIGETYIYVGDRGNDRVVRLRMVDTNQVIWDNEIDLDVSPSFLDAGVGPTGIEDVETDDTDLGRSGVFVLHSGVREVIQFDYDLEVELQRRGGFFHPGGAYDLDTSRGLLTVLTPFTESTGIEIFKVPADIEALDLGADSFNFGQSIAATMNVTSAATFDAWVERVTPPGTGTVVKTLVSGELVGAGQKQVSWNGLNNAGQPSSSGMYRIVCRVTDTYTSEIATESVDVEFLYATQIIEVAAGGGGDFTTIQAAVLAANYGDIVLVESGTYAESIVMRERVTVKGAGPGVIIVGTGSNHAVRIENLTRPVLLKDVEITHVASDNGAGVNIFNASPAIEGCTVRDINNYNAQNGGGVRISGTAAPTFVDCEFRNNKASHGGGVGIWGTGTNAPTASFVDCRFIDNDGKTGKGGAVWMQYATRLDLSKAQPSFVDCRFDGNTALDGGAIWMDNCDRPLFESCVFSDNTATSPTFGCTIGSETGSAGCGASIVKCTFAYNVVPPTGCVIGAVGTSPTGKTVFLDKSIIASNTNAYGVRSGYEPRYDVKYCDFFGNASGDAGWLTTGTGNLNQNPAFCSAAGGDYRLYAFSPAAAGPILSERIGALDVGCVPSAALSAIGPVASCPLGDSEVFIDELIVTINFEDVVMTRTVGQNEIKLDLSDFNYAKVFDENNALTASTPATSANGYLTTIEHKAFGGCSTNDAVDVLLNGTPLTPPATVTIRTWDLIAPWGQYSLQDFAAFGVGGCPRYNVPNDCSNYDGDTDVDLNDFAWFGAHHGHTSLYGPANAPPGTIIESSASVALQFSEEYTTATVHKLYVAVELTDFSDVTTALFRLKTGNPRLTFAAWEPAEQLLGNFLVAPVDRDGVPHVYFGASVSDEFTGPDAQVGRMVFEVSGQEPFVVASDDFVMTYGEVLLESSGELQVAAQMTGVLERTANSEVVRVIHNRLEQNFPNPFNPSTTIAFSLKNGGRVSLTIYDVAGRRVRELLNERRERGAYKVVWDGQNDAGEMVASGVYFYKIVVGSFTDTKKMTMLK